MYGISKHKVGFGHRVLFTRIPCSHPSAPAPRPQNCTLLSRPAANGYLNLDGLELEYIKIHYISACCCWGLCWLTLVTMPRPLPFKHLWVGQAGKNKAHGTQLRVVRPHKHGGIWSYPWWLHDRWYIYIYIYISLSYIYTYIYIHILWKPGQFTCARGHSLI